jgi:hypothetical protein
VRSALKLILIVVWLSVHLPTHKATAANARDQSTTSSACHTHCCSKCSKKAPIPAEPKPQPANPKPCPPDCTCSLCSAPAAVVPEATATTDLHVLSPERVGFVGPLAAPDGFRALLDRPPRV